MSENEVRYLLNAFMGMNGLTDEDMAKAGYYKLDVDVEALREAANHMWDSREALQRWQALASDLAGSVLVGLDE